MLLPSALGWLAMCFVQKLEMLLRRGWELGQMKVVTQSWKFKCKDQDQNLWATAPEYSGVSFATCVVLSTVLFLFMVRTHREISQFPQVPSEEHLLSVIGVMALFFIDTCVLFLDTWPLSLSKISFSWDTGLWTLLGNHRGSSLLHFLTREFTQWH